MTGLVRHLNALNRSFATSAWLSAAPNYNTYTNLRNTYRTEIQRLDQLASSTWSNSVQQNLPELETVFKLYEQLKPSRVLLSNEVSRVIQAVHNCARSADREAFKKLRDNKLDFRESFRPTLLVYLESIASDIAEGEVKVSPFGLMQLISAFATLSRPERGIELWMRLRDTAESESADENVKSTAETLVSSPKVVGAIMLRQIETGAPIDEIVALYESTEEKNIIMEKAMISAYLHYGKTSEAVHLFTDILPRYPDERNYLSDIQNLFIGDNIDLTVAKTFFNQAVSGATPYKVSVHASSFSRLLERMWIQDHNFEEVTTYFFKYVEHCRQRRSPPMKSLQAIVTFVKMFVEEYPEYNEQNMNQLNSIIEMYDAKFGLNELFLNNILSRISVWHSEAAVNGVLSWYSNINFTLSPVNLRIFLNAYGSVHTSQNEDFNAAVDRIWKSRLLLANEVQRGNELTLVDFIALAKACDREGAADIFINAFKENIDSCQGMISPLLRYLESHRRTDGPVYQFLLEARVAGLESADHLEAPKDTVANPEST